MSSLANPSRPFGSLLTAMVTPMLPNGDIDIDSTVAVARHLVDTGHDGIVLHGTTGESPTTHAPEKELIIREVRAAVGPEVILVAGAGSNDTRHSVRMAQAAQHAGADGLLVVTPYYLRPAQEGVRAHITEIVNATDIPVMLYDIPGRTGLRLASGTIDALAELDRVVAVKDATGDVVAGLDAMRRTGLAWYSGDDPLTLAFMAGGASGVVSVVGHIAGKKIRALLDAFAANDVHRAMELHHEIQPLTHAIMDGGLGAVTAKAALELLGIIPNRNLRLPHVAATEAEVADLAQTLRKAGLLNG